MPTFSRPDVPVAQRRVRGDPRAEQRRHGGKLGFRMAHVQHVAFVHHNLLRITAESVSGRVCRGAVVGENHMVAVIFQPCFALFTLLTAVDHTADADQISHVESRDLIADGGHLADDFMSRHARIERTGPFRSRLMKVGVADAAVIDGDLHIVGAGRGGR